MTTCGREGCGHDRVMHPRAGACRMPGCACEAFVRTEAGPASAEEHAHRWQPAGLLLDGGSIAALCPCGAVARFAIPDGAANA